MKGENFTRIGLSLFMTGLVLLITWFILYDKETDVILENKIAPQSNSSKALVASGSIVLTFGYILSLVGFAITTDLLKFSLKMPKNNLIET